MFHNEGELARESELARLLKEMDRNNTKLVVLNGRMCDLADRLFSPAPMPTAANSVPSELTASPVVPRLWNATNDMQNLLDHMSNLIDRLDQL